MTPNMNSENPQPGTKVLVVDDSELVLQLCRHVLEARGYEVVTKLTAFEGFMSIKSERPDVVLLDLSMPGLTGDILLKVVQAAVKDHKAKVLFHSDRSEAELLDIVERSGADGYIHKTDDDDLFIRHLEGFLKESAS